MIQTIHLKNITVLKNDIKESMKIRLLFTDKQK